MNRQPQQGATIAAPCRNGLKVLWTGAMGFGLQNLAPGGGGGILLTPTGSPTPHGVISDKGIKHGEFGQSAVAFDVTSNASTLTLLVRVQFLSSGAELGFFEWQTGSSLSSGAPRALLQQNNTDLRYYDGSGYVLTQSGVATAGSVHNIVLRVSSAGAFIYRNGVKTSTSAPGSNSADRIFFGSGYSSVSYAAQSIGAWWEADIGDAAAMELSKNPWAVFVDPAESRNRLIRSLNVPAGGSSIAAISNYHRMLRAA